ncbi:MAG: mandelate racemase [Planctomycetes bacterium]|nr:mandelate racemase [Planctomycetota bacterium]MCB9875962.1 mandelate racemase [Planctomycetota bacterium]MCB9887783.1 mandelate racemase [Planctomycetota bacterium]
MNRRRFLALTGSAAAAACAGAPTAPRPRGGGIRIDRIDLFAVRYPMTGYFKFFTGPHGGAGRAAVLIKVTADDGSVGWGQSVPIAKWSDETLETATVALREYFVPALIGRDPEDLAGAQAALSAAIAPGFSTGMPITRAGLDLALHDLIGKRAGKSLAQLWGLPTKETLTLSWTVNVTKLDDVEAVMQAGREHGYRHFNIKVGPDPAFDVQLAQAVRRLAPDCFLWADANGGYAPEDALRAAPLLADAGVSVLEAPLRPNLISGYRALKKQGALPILMDEGVITPTDLREFHALGMLDGVAMKPSRCGGLVSCKAQIEFCIANGLMWLGSGLTDPDVSFAATLQLYAALGLQKPAALNGPQFLTADVLRAPIRVENGEAFVPQGPGLGVEVDEDKVRALVRRTG